MSFIFGGNTNMTYEDVQKKRALANQLAAQNAKGSRNVGEGLGAIGRALAYRAIDKRASKREGELKAEADDIWNGIFGTADAGMRENAGTPFVPNATMPPPVTTRGEGAGVADDTMTALGVEPMGQYRDAIASIESAGSGDYAAVGPTDPKLGRALGKFQVMEANIGPWSKEILGREVSPEEFLQNPRIQDAIFDGKFGQYVQKFGPDGAAQAWFGGEGGVGEVSRRDSLGTSIGEYTNKFRAAQGQPGSQPQSGGTPSMQQIAAAMSNPMIQNDPGKMAILQGLLGKAMAGPETAKPTSLMQNVDWLVSQGVPFEEALQQVRGGTSITNNVGGEAAKPLGTRGQILVEDSSAPSGYRVELAEGSEAWQDAQDAAASSKVADENTARSGGVVTEDIDAALGILEEDPNWTTGFGSMLKIVPGTQAKSLNGLLTTIKANVGFDRLQQMRDASVTGGALGAINKTEMDLLQSVLGNLDQSLSAEDLARNLKRVNDIYLRIIHEGIPPEEAKMVGFMEDPANIAAAEKYGVTLEEMWEAQQ